jgi:serine/threonine protein kinase
VATEKQAQALAQDQDSQEMSEPALRLLEAYRSGLQRGEGVPLGELLKDCPDQRAELEQQLHILETLQKASQLLAEDSTISMQGVPTRTFLLPGTRVGKCTILGLLGCGGMGEVYLAVHEGLDRQVAIKVLPEELAHDPAFVNRFSKEKLALGRLARPHENVVFAQDAGTHDGRHYVEMEYVPGINLKKLVENEGPLPFTQVWKILRGVALGLRHLHKHKIIHRDIKPSNLILTLEGEIKILDMGLARIAGPPISLQTGMQSQAGSVLGTFDYISPEQTESSRDADQRSDLYSLGCTAYHLLTGQPPFPHRTPMAKLAAHLHETPRLIRVLNPDVPETLAVVVERLMARQPEDRYQSAQELVDHLERLTHESPNLQTDHSPNPQQLPIDDPGRSRRSETALFGVFPVRSRASTNSPRAEGLHGRHLSRAWVPRALVVCGVGIGVVFGGWLLNLRRDQSATQMIPNSTSSAQQLRARLRLDPIVVDYYRLSADKKQSDPTQRMGDGAVDARFDDAVVLSIPLAEPVYCYVLGFAANGAEQLLWHSDSQGKDMSQVPPPQVGGLLRLPLGGKQFRLDEEPAGGLQVYVIAAARQPLPAYERWRRQLRTPVTWKRQTGFNGVWQADENGTYPMIKGQTKRSVKPPVGVPPLAQLCQELKSGGVEAVEAIAFPVAARREKE